jgi:uncharacterized protein (TIGR02444 family)
MELSMTLPAGRQCWDFVVELYAKPGVSQACLELQDRLGVDVSFLLTVLFHVKSRNIDPSAEQIQSLDLSISAWRDETVATLRRLRRHLKASDQMNPSIKDLYQRIKTDELLAEQIEIGILTQQLEQIGTPPSVALLKRDATERVVSHFARSSGQDAHLHDPEIQHAISTLYDSAR